MFDFLEKTSAGRVGQGSPFLGLHRIGECLALVLFCEQMYQFCDNFGLAMVVTGYTAPGDFASRRSASE